MHPFDRLTLRNLQDIQGLEAVEMRVVAVGESWTGGVWKEEVEIGLWIGMFWIMRP